MTLKNQIIAKDAQIKELTKTLTHVEKLLADEQKMVNRVLRVVEVLQVAGCVTGAEVDAARTLVNESQ